jgi:hypothetical protein
MIAFLYLYVTVEFILRVSVSTVEPEASLAESNLDNPTGESFLWDV